MQRYAAMLRGVTPINAKMPELKECFEAAGFSNVRTVLSSGNVVFDARPASEATLVRKAEDAMQKRLGRSFVTILRPVDALRALLDVDPFMAYRLAPGSKRIVTFLREAPTTTFPLPIELDGARILRLEGREVFSAYMPSPRGPVFMALIGKTFGEALTTRTWDTVRKLAASPPASRTPPSRHRR